ncbi:hypothetical protein [uncultured Mediterranean phage uvMED]|jgi:hypothetical protein|nr:hypothetical protein [uncultured Mediterranean phage uvMED]
MKIKITSDRNPWANGSPRVKDDEIELDDAEAKALIDAGMAIAYPFIKASELKDMDLKPKRARTAKGHLKADDPSTPEVNEAWEGGVAPKKRGRPKKK